VTVPEMVDQFMVRTLKQVVIQYRVDYAGPAHRAFAAVWSTMAPIFARRPRALHISNLSIQDPGLMPNGGKLEAPFLNIRRPIKSTDLVWAVRMPHGSARISGSGWNGIQPHQVDAAVGETAWI